MGASTRQPDASSTTAKVELGVHLAASEAIKAPRRLACAPIPAMFEEGPGGERLVWTSGHRGAAMGQGAWSARWCAVLHL